MRNRNRRQRELEKPFDPIEWPDPQVGADDKAFAEAIAQGRDEQQAA
jgi:hypothetical protein